MSISVRRRSLGTALILLPLLACAAQPAARRAPTAGSYAGTPFAPPRTVELAGSVVDVPLVKDGDFYFVDVHLNGRPFRFTLETGAGFFAVSQRAARSLGLAVDSIEVMQGARTPVVRVDSLRLGGALMRDLVARVNPSWDNGGFDGIISVSVLRDLLATIDLSRRTLRLERGSLPEPNGRDIVQIIGQDRGGRVDIPVTLGSVTVPAVLDTRSMFWIMTPDSMESQLPLAAPPVFATNAYGPAQGSFQLRGARLGDAARIGGATIERPAVLLRNRSGTVLGVPLMEQFAITLDQRNGRVRLTPRTADTIRIPAAEWETAAQVAPSPTASAPAPSEGAARRPAAPPNAGTLPPSGTWTMGMAMGGPPGGTVTVMRVFAGSSAEKEGIRAGDQLVEFNGTPAAQMNPAVSRAAANGGKPVKVVVLREGRRLEFTIAPYQIP